MIAVDAVAAPSILSTEVEAESNLQLRAAAHRPLEIERRARGRERLAFDIGMLTVPEPVMLVVAEIVPVPLIVPPLSVMSLASVNCVLPAASSFMVPLVTVCAALIVRLPALPISSVWLELLKVLAVPAHRDRRCRCRRAVDLEYRGRTAELKLPCRGLDRPLPEVAEKPSRRRTTVPVP